MESTRTEETAGGTPVAGNPVDGSGRLEILTPEAAVRRITKSLLEHSNEIPREMTILEAGCGRKWELDLETTDFEITGVDLDEHALEHRRSVTQDLDTGIVGSVCDRDIVPSSHFDVVYSAYVLEHIDGAEKALENFIEWARPGGLIVMWLPNRNSVYGWIAQHTPYRFHVWVYRYFFGNHNAGKPGFSPYPTFHDPVLAPSALTAFCRDRNLSVQELFAIDVFTGRPGAKYTLARKGMRLMSLLSRGRLVDREVDLGIVIRKPLA